MPESTGSGRTSTTWRVGARQPVDYEVVIARGLLEPQNRELAQACGADGVATRCLVLIDDAVDVLYGEALRAYFDAWSIDTSWTVINGSEESKSIAQVVAATEAMSSMGILRRAEKVIAIGGGAVLDVAGMAASLYRRGVPYVRVPTTLIGQVDAGVGVKTGVNYGTHKNRLGSYYAPEKALIDPEFLRTVPQRHINNGMAEIAKMALIKDRELFELLESVAGEVSAATLADAGPHLLEIMTRAIGGMLDELEPNLWEHELERVVDYGHTFSPSLELRADPPLLHGEAVAVDMAVCVAVAHNRGLLGHEGADRALALLQALGLPTTDPVFTTELLAESLQDAVRHRDGAQRVPLTSGLGSAVFVNDIDDGELAAALEFVRAAAGTGLVRASR
ncbi:sedoheptulose 7-phosphate cyclase [Saccharopolyspora sp. HNM0986]|uniref:sedoheptulose 7-phosphate cyclase n=1 Tax=Saccharopolyspora galaxeae TaxID=2781241 RepID=UPI00190C9883|nr:sedoheptulose 7-phosphate cyclase [Saccharopolyspora sp. HNM0986]MBK0869278.1 sedoheptulose 7-phosphate cyclase [Saccharopolyspora sp. HNM0986]